MNRIMTLSRRPLNKVLMIAALVASAAGCSFAPKYNQPAVETPAAFKENSPTNLWQLAQPGDAVIRSNWWATFNDAELNALEDQVAISNQNVAAAVATLLEARAVVRKRRRSYGRPWLRALP